MTGHASYLLLVVADSRAVLRLHQYLVHPAPPSRLSPCPAHNQRARDGCTHWLLFKEKLIESSTLLLAVVPWVAGYARSTISTCWHRTQPASRQRLSYQHTGSSVQPHKINTYVGVILQRPDGDPWVGKEVELSTAVLRWTSM